jgi:membrane protease YdiL (CAAX protease family)
MSDAFRGLVLLVSVVLWLPVLRPLLAGEISAAEAGLRYAVALLLAWGGGSMLASIVRSYSDGAGAGDATDAGESHPLRRQEDAAE